ncbi:5'-deoxyadenosine deaminase [Maledivibacter halophilus]|uniref:5-methylthioadenosine/S-adenosylhomocysteine deaminase n=1 Tax=Maledivibacter halophilus TaxID=36842 RepID=A0A1T5JUC3_9FIRM|nr:5'-deoxyadenosine deaminase [Maledivibacter halophilus]SKC54967.1 5-methylthioadenosine/S-adenosylhomocysteine deaminase [Maledivibacter halophilus]
MSTLKITEGTIVTMNKERQIFKGDIFIKDDRIDQIAPSIGKSGDLEIDAKGKIIIPGLIQTHVHLTQTLFKGKADDLELLDWLRKRIWPLEGGHTAKTNYISAKLGIAELIKSGTTSIIDMETVNHTESALNAIEESGFRAIIGKCMMDYGVGVPKTLMEDTNESINESVRLLKKWHKSANGRIQYAFAPRFVVSCTEELLIRVRDLSKEYGVMVHTHASENRKEIELVERDRGMRNIKYLHKLGMTGEDLILSHCVWLDDEEMKILADTGTKIAHCPNSNLKLASGIAKIPELLELGANVSIAIDGAPCNNNLDIFREMRSAALIQKARLLNPTAMPAEKVFELATINGAKAMGMENELGSLEVGKKADITIVDLNDISNAPHEGSNIISQLVYSASGHNVETTIIDGKIVMRNRELLTLNERSIIDDANMLIKQQMEKFTIK